MATNTVSNGSYLQNADPQSIAANPAAATASYQPMGNTTPQANQTQQQQASPGDMSKDEVGWYFVEQYYTTLNKTPERLHLFYNRKSSFVWGTEGESLPLAQGRTEIQEKIAAHGFKDCKVRVSNVDSQGSAGNGIVIQVLGEMSNDGNPNRKFAQTFFLAEQPNGYYVLNDMFRYLKDDDDIEEGDYEYSAPEAAEPEVAEAVEEIVEQVAEAIEDITVKETHTVEVDMGDGDVTKVEETRTVEPEEVAEAVAEEIVEAAAVEEAVEATAEAVAEAIEEATAAAEPEAVEPVEETKPEPTPEPVAPVEKPVETPAVSAPKEAAPPAPAPAPVPARPKTWASLVATKPAAAAAAAAAAAPAATPTAAPAVSAPSQVAPASTAAPVAATAATAATPVTQATPAAASQWQTAEKKGRSNVPQQTQTAAYIKNVTDAVSQQALKDTLQKYGNLKHFEINKVKTCAFVDFETPAGFAAAHAANPHVINGVNVLVEERRPRGPPNNFGPRVGGRGDGRAPMRGGYVPRGDGQGRGGAARGGARGGFAGRGGFRTSTPGA